MRLLALLAAGAAAIAQPAQPAFDVASVKPSAPAAGDLIDINLGAANHGTVTMRNVTFSECVLWAYGLVGEAQVSGPVWINDRSIRFDITAKAPTETPIEQLRLTMQTLLAERFAPELHTEPKRIEHFELSVDKDGARLKASGHEQQGRRPVLIVSPDAFNAVTRVPLVVPVTSGGSSARTAGFAVSLSGAGTRTAGVIRCDQPRALDLRSRAG